MQLRSRLKWFVALAILGYAASPAGAQTASTQGVQGGAGAPNAPSQPAPQVGFHARVVLTPEQQVAEAENVVAFAANASQTVARRLQSARMQHDVVKVLCLNDKLSQVDVAGKSAQERRTAHAAAVGRHDAELATHEFTILTVLRQRVEQLMTEANQCIGEEAAYTGATTTFTTVDPNLPPEEPPTFNPIEPVNVPSPPVEVAPPSVSPAQ
jgi:hypothetical protein